MEYSYRREDGEKLKDIDAIREYVVTFSAQYVQKGLAQGQEILAMDPFPAEWVMSTCNCYPEGKSHETTDEDYYHWVQWMIRALEEEARRVGKL